MNKLRLEKEIEINRITASLKESASFYVSEYKGLRVSDLQELREKLRPLLAEVRVCKNRLLKIAAQRAGVADLGEHLKGQNIFIFSKEEGSQVAKLLFDFAKERKELVLKAGLWEGELIDSKGIEEVAKLPTYEGALTMLAISLLNPLQNLALSLKLLSEEREGASS